MTKSTEQKVFEYGGLLLILFTVFFGCAAKKPSWGDPKTGFILNYRLAPGQILAYHTTTKQSTNMEMMGQPIDVETDILFNYSLKGIGSDEQKNILTEITLDTASITANSPQGKQTFDLSSLIGKNFGLTLSPMGEELQYSGIDSLPEIDFGQMSGGKRDAKSFFVNPFPNLPQNPIRIGETWTDKGERTMPQGNMEITVKTESKNIIEKLEIMDSVECLKINSQSTGTLDGEGQQMGMDMVFEGDLESTTTWYFAYKKGIFVKMTSEQFVEATIAVSGQTSMTIPLTQETNTEIRLSY